MRTLPLILLLACLEEPGTTKVGSSSSWEEEPSSEPATEQNDEFDTGDQNNEASDEDTNTEPEPSGEPSSEPSNEDTDVQAGTLSPDNLLFSFMNGYANGDITSVTFPNNGSLSGSFTVILYDSSAQDYCAIDWLFDASNSQPDTTFDGGFVPDAFSGNNIAVWYGFIVTSTPQTRGSCDALTTEWSESLDAIMLDRPGFGYGPLTSDLEASMIAEHPAGWSNVSNHVFAGIASLTVFNNGNRSYFPINQGYSYTMNNGITDYDPSITDVPQGTELMVGNMPSNAFYLSNYYFGLSFQ